MGPHSRRPANYDDLRALPENMVGQIIDDELFAHPRPASDHALSASGLGALVGQAFGFGRGGPGGWWIIDEPELHFGRDVLVTDLTGWRRERMPSIPRVPYFELAPDWVCEVLSPSTSSVDRVKKKHIYGREKVEYLWYVDPQARTLEALQLRDDAWVELGSWAGEESIRAPPFEAVELELGLLWIPQEP